MNHREVTVADGGARRGIVTARGGACGGRDPGPASAKETGCGLSLPACPDYPPR